MLETGHGVERLLAPKSIAVIGASGDTKKASFTGATGILANLVKFGYKGGIYPINPKYETVQGLKAYPNLASLPESVDMVVVGVKSEEVLPILEEAREKGVGSCLIIASGFGEDRREEHRRMQRRMSELAAESGVRICGPNCLGIINVHQNIVAISSVGLTAGPVNPGGVALISQSGALVSSLLARAKDKGIGFSYVVSSGNEADLQLSDYVRFIVDDPNTKAIAAYIEGIKNADKFKEVASLCWKKNKPLIAFKVGRSEKGARAAQAHTGAIAGSDEVINAMFEKYNVLRVNSLDGLLEISHAFSHIPRRRLGDSCPRLGVITVSGGTGSIISDISQDLGLDIPELEPETIRCLESFLPAYTSVKNPVDTTAGVLREPDTLAKALKAVEEDRNVDTVHISLTAASPDFEVKVVDAIVKHKEHSQKPFVVSWYSGNMNLEGVRRLQSNGVACFTSHELALSFAKLWARKDVDCVQVSAPGDLGDGEKKVVDFLEKKRGVLSEFDSKQVLRGFGIPIVEEVNALSLSDARNAAESIGFPVVVKINSPDIPHKSEAGCVAINIRNTRELESAYGSVIENAIKFRKDADLQGVLVQEMVQNARECIIGVKSDPQFGPVVMFGLGGVFVEVLKDVAFSMAPLSEEEARDMIKRIKGYRILEGYRRQGKSDVDALVDVLQKVGRLAYSLRNTIKELDINPLMVLDRGKGAKVADALVILGDRPAAGGKHGCCRADR